MRYAERNSVYGINKAGLIKRIAAFFLDFVIFALVTVGVCSLVLTITDYDGYREKLEEKYEYHGVYEPIDPSIPLEEQVVGAFCVPEKEGDACSVAWYNFNTDEEAILLLHTCTSITLATSAVGVLAGVMVAYFLIPLLLKNGQTFGKKFMRLALINREGVRLRNINLFIRCLFGIYVVELMIPFYAILYIFSMSSGAIFALAIFLGIVVSNLFLLVGSKYGNLIHDLIGKTIVVEFDGQAIFDTVEELEKFKQIEEQKNIEYAKKKGY